MPIHESFRALVVTNTRLDPSSANARLKSKQYVPSTDSTLSKWSQGSISKQKISLSSKPTNKDLGWITKYYISYQPQPQIQEIPRRFGWDCLSKLPLWCLSSRSAEAPALFAFGRTQKAVWSCCSSSVTRGLKLIKNTNQIWWWSWLTMHQQKKLSNLLQWSSFISHCWDYTLLLAVGFHGSTYDMSLICDHTYE